MAQTSTENKAEEIEKYLRVLANIRQDFEPQWDNIFTYIDTNRRRVTDLSQIKGQKTGQEVYDGTALSCVNMLVDGMVGMLCAPNSRWFRYSIPAKMRNTRSLGMRAWLNKPLDEYPQVRRWLDDCADQAYSAFNRSNFYDVFPQFLRDGICPGTSHLIAEEDITSGRIMFTVPHVRECFIAENQFGRVDTNYRVYKLTLRQLADKFGYDKMKQLDVDFHNAYKSNMHAEREVIHAVYPRKDRDQQKDDGRNKPIASEWILRTGAAPAMLQKFDNSKLIAEEGYYMMPVISWRWRKNNDEIYGRSPAWDSFIPIYLANQQARSNLIAGQKSVEPPMVALDYLRNQVQLGPNGFTFVTSMAEQPQPLNTGIKLPYAVDALTRTEKQIRDNFAVDLFLALSQAAANKVELTATQVVEIIAEKAAVLATRVGMLQSEALSPTHDRVVDIEMRARRMPDAPDIVYEYVGEPITVQYLGALSQAQERLAKLRVGQSAISISEQYAQVAPQCLDRVDWDAAFVDALYDAGFSSKYIRSEEDTASIRQMRAQAEQHDKEVEMMSPMAKLLRAAGPKPEPGSPAQKLLNPEESPAAGGGA
jgi:hypothetical protein